MVMTVDDVDLVVGVDTHLDPHTAAICDWRGRPLAELRVATTPAGYEQLLAWATEAGEGGRLVWAVEGTRHYGVGLARFLAGRGHRVVEIDRARHVGKRRAGKSDPIDAVRAAKEVLARPVNSTPRADGASEALRMLMVERDSTVDALRSTRTLLTSLIVTAPADLRERLRGLSRARRATTCAGLVCPDGADLPTRVVYESLARLGQRALELHGLAERLEADIAKVVSRQVWSPPRTASAR